MTITTLALAEIALLVGGALAAGRLMRLVVKYADRVTVLIASVTLWVVLFGVLPAFVFALYVRQVGGGGGDPGWEFLVLGALPFTMIASPLIGFFRGMRLYRLKSRK